MFTIIERWSKRAMPVALTYNHICKLVRLPVHGSKKSLSSYLSHYLKASIMNVSVYYVYFIYLYISLFYMFAKRAIHRKRLVVWHLKEEIPSKDIVVLFIHIFLYCHCSSLLYLFYVFIKLFFSFLQWNF